MQRNFNGTYRRIIKHGNACVLVCECACAHMAPTRNTQILKACSSGVAGAKAKQKINKSRVGALECLAWPHKSSLERLAWPHKSLLQVQQTTCTDAQIVALSHRTRDVYYRIALSPAACECACVCARAGNRSAVASTGQSGLDTPAVGQRAALITPHICGRALLMGDIGLVVILLAWEL